MQPSHVALFLQLCLVAAVAAAQSPEQELQAEAQKLLTSMFTKCGDDYFSKQGFDITYGDAYVIGQYKDLTPHAQIKPPTQFDALNKIQWLGVIRFTASRIRSFVHGPALVRRKRVPADRIDTWGEWRKTSLPDFTFHASKREGTIHVGIPKKARILPLKCNEIPKG
jgi:hypothetical protein